MALFSRNNISHLVFNMYTDLKKEKLYVKISSGDLDETPVQVVESELETALMTTEEAAMMKYIDMIRIDDKRIKRELFVKENRVLFDQYTRSLQELVANKERIEEVIDNELRILDESLILLLEASKLSALDYVYRRLKTMESSFCAFCPNDIAKKNIEDILYCIADDAVNISLLSCQSPIGNSFSHYPSEVSSFIDSVSSLRGLIAGKHSNGHITIIPLEFSGKEHIYQKRESTGRNNFLRCTATADNEESAIKRKLKHEKGIPTQNFRSYLGWTGVNMICSGQKDFYAEVFKNQSKFYMISEPTFGPFDIFSLKFYDIEKNIFLNRLFIPPFITAGATSAPSGESITLEKACAGFVFATLYIIVSTLYIA
jgi:hypothetical protein